MTFQLTAVDMQSRLGALLSVRKSKMMSLRESAELDAIRNHGLAGWTDFKKKTATRRARKAGAR